jgi:oxygen-independent coproporphyrinogen III oxidase
VSGAATSLPTLLARGDGETGVGGHFVSNYPPYAAWSSAGLAEVEAILARPPARDVPMGLYLHVPFCRKRCRFCYFKVQTDATADEVSTYVEGLVRELELWAQVPAIAGRAPRFVYFGGGTPSYLSTAGIERLLGALRSRLPWHSVEEVTFECEPGTVTEAKLRALADAGVTRLSIGVESFDDAVLEVNGRSHRSRQVEQAYAAARRAGLPQVNVDLIAGLIGESREQFEAGVRRTIELAPDSVTIYQLEVPPSTLLSREAGSVELLSWPEKRARAARAFELFEAAGYRVSSAYTVVRGDATFAYRDHLWTGADLLGLGVSAFSQVQGAHFQDEKDLAAWQARVEAGERPLQRGYAMSDDERLVREFILQLKLGRVEFERLKGRFGIDPAVRFADGLAALARAGLATVGEEAVVLGRDALLRVDSLLPLFYRPEHAVRGVAA